MAWQDWGEINPKTRVFKTYSSCMGNCAFYKRATNGVIREVRVKPEELHRLKRLEEVLAIEGISIAKESIPGNK
jgi:hypothetical protein